MGAAPGLVGDAAHEATPRQNHQRAIDLLGDDRPTTALAAFGDGQPSLRRRQRFCRICQNVKKLGSQLLGAHDCAAP
ncbi:hypothetical protein A5700_23440 [Mycobacterium sp. E1214]|nr:hypothetical protein A5700_23440 [Mycobacterium sp. E1214]OBH31806.1 hypothetical protein A5693_01440 [Mycobacterium sp. E1319]